MWHGAVQFLDGTFRLAARVKPNKTDALRKTGCLRTYLKIATKNGKSIETDKKENQQKLAWCVFNTGDAVAEDARRNNASKRRKKSLQFALTHCFGNTTDVQVGSFDILAAGSSKRNLRSKGREHNKNTIIRCFARAIFLYQQLSNATQ